MHTASSPLSPTPRGKTWKESPPRQVAILDSDLIPHTALSNLTAVHCHLIRHVVGCTLWTHVWPLCVPGDHSQGLAVLGHQGLGLSGGPIEAYLPICGKVSPQSKSPIANSCIRLITMLIIINRSVQE